LRISFVSEDVEKGSTSDMFAFSDSFPFVYKPQN